MQGGNQSGCAQRLEDPRRSHRRSRRQRLIPARDIADPCAARSPPRIGGRGCDDFERFTTEPQRHGDSFIIPDAACHAGKSPMSGTWFHSDESLNRLRGLCGSVVTLSDVDRKITHDCRHSGGTDSSRDTDPFAGALPMGRAWRAARPPPQISGRGCGDFERFTTEPQRHGDSLVILDAACHAGESGLSGTWFHSDRSINNLRGSAALW
jgi:hypothetical protein